MDVIRLDQPLLLTVDLLRHSPRSTSYVDLRGATKPELLGVRLVYTIVESVEELGLDNITGNWPLG
jgi:hypothetical protein